jgi:hypothetical protein
LHELPFSHAAIMAVNPRYSLKTLVNATTNRAEVPAGFHRYFLWFPFVEGNCDCGVTAYKKGEISFGNSCSGDHQLQRNLQRIRITRGSATGCTLQPQRVSPFIAGT